MLIHWLLHGEKTLGNYLFRQKCIEHVERTLFFQSADDSNEEEEEELEEEEEEVKEEMIPQVEELVLPSLLGSRETTYNIL